MIKRNIELNNIENSSHSTEKNLLGWWIYLMGDCILFATLFSVYCVTSSNVIVDHHLFNTKFVFIETSVLLLSSLLYSFFVICFRYKKTLFLYLFLILSFVCGMMFIMLELLEFHNLFQLGYYPQTNSFFSSFFTLIGMHGLHVIIGLLWMLGIFIQIFSYGLNNSIYNRILYLGLFWHFLDIIWICVFTIVYLIGSL